MKGRQIMDDSDEKGVNGQWSPVGEGEMVTEAAKWVKMVTKGLQIMEFDEKMSRTK